MLKVFVRSTKIDRLTRSSQLCVLVYQNKLLSIAEEGTTTRQLTHLKLLSAQVKFIQELADLAKTKNRPHYAESTSQYIELIMQTLLAHGTNPIVILRIPYTVQYHTWSGSYALFHVIGLRRFSGGALLHRRPGQVSDADVTNVLGRLFRFSF